MGPKPRKTSSDWCLANFSFQRYAYCQENTLLRNSKLYVFGSSATSVLKFSTELDIFIKHPKNGIFLQCSMDSPVQCYLEKANMVENLCSWYLVKKNSE